MAKLIFQGVSMEINKVKITEHLTFTATGLCCVLVNPNCGKTRECLLIFSKTYMHSGNEIKTTGNVFFNGKVLPASKFHYLLNQHVLFEGNESVMEGLQAINSAEAAEIARLVEIHFTNKRADHLNVQESRLFEVAVALAARPRVAYLRMGGLSDRQRNRCVELLAEYAKENDNVVFVECDEFDGTFESALAVEEDGIYSLESEEAERLYRRRRLTNIGITLSEFPKEVEKPPADAKAYDYAQLFNKYKTERTVDLKHRKMSSLERLTTLDFYKINISHAFSLGYRKYEMTFQKYEKRMGVVLSFFPTFMFIIALRLFGDHGSAKMIECVINALPFLPDAIFSRQPTIILVFCTNVFQTPIVFLRSLFRQGFSIPELRLIFGSACFSIMYQYSSIFDEDCQVLNYNVNVLMTPGTYIASIFIFTALTHFPSFIVIGFLFNLPLMFHNLIISFFINLIYFGILGKRLKTTFIGFFIASHAFSAILNPSRPTYKTVMFAFFTVFPILIRHDRAEWMFSGGLCMAYAVVYCIAIYVLTCYRISSY